MSLWLMPGLLSLKREKWSHMGFLRVSSNQFCWSDFTLTWQGGNKRKKEGKRGGRELFKGGDYFKYFRLKRAINRDTAIIRRNTTDSCSSSLPLSKMEYKARNHPYPGQRFRFQPYSERL